MKNKLFFVSLIITIVLIVSMAAVPAECRCSIAGKNYDSQYDDESTVVITTTVEESISLPEMTTAEETTAEETYVEETMLEGFMLDLVLKESGMIFEDTEVLPLTEIPIFSISERDGILSRSFLSFDVSALKLEKGTIIKEVELCLLNGDEIENPFSFYELFIIDAVDYGERPLKMEDYKISSYPIDFLTKSNIVLNTEDLKNEFQKVIDKGGSRFQIGLQFMKPKTENREAKFGIAWEFKNISLKVRY